MKASKKISRTNSELNLLGKRLKNYFKAIVTQRSRALLTAESAVAHLYHFCAMLPHQRYVDLRPDFTFAEDVNTHRINGTVILPNGVSTSVRCTSGRQWWQTERAARKEAAFQAYVALYEAGLVNDNLLPLNREGTVVRDAREELPPMMEVSEQLNPWVSLAKAWALPEPNQTVISIQQQDVVEGGEVVMILTTPLAMPCMQPFTLYWDSKTTFEVRPGASQQVAAIYSESLRFMQDIMHTLLRSTHSDQRPDNRKDFVALFTPNIHEQQFETWLSVNRGSRLALEEFHLNRGVSPRSFVRSSLYFGVPHIFHRWRTPSSDGAETEVEVECFALPKRRNFLEAGTLSEKVTGLASWSEYSTREARSFPAKSCTIDFLPIEQARFSLFIPAITQHIEVLMVANQLCQTILKNVPFRDIHHVITAISASSTQSATNYQRYEFLGDSILKFIVSTQLFVDHENWHEGYLSEGRAILVSNSYLARAALDTGLDSFILTKPFIGKGWTYPLISELEIHSAGKRTVSSKTLADVVEALIGAAFLDGGLSAARGCTHAFLPDIRTPSLVFGSGAHSRSAKVVKSSIYMMAELLIDHRFLDKGLLQEALTHPSCERDTLTESYQRLEFLGDAVLDMIVVTAIFEEKPNCSHGSMSQIKAAIVNANLLAFLCLEVSLTQDAVHIQQEGERTFYEVHEEEKIELWKFMRRHGREITEAQQACVKRHQQLRRDIERCLKYDRLYPWALLAQLDAEKFFSDIIESVFGAIFVDTGGTLADCQRFAERIGILPYLRRIMSDGIDVVHPKASLERLTGPDKIEYIVGFEESDNHVYQCSIKINNIEVVTVGGCLTKDEAVMRAADSAAKLISRTKYQATRIPSQHM